MAASPSPIPPITVSVVTRDRPAPLLRNLQSLRLIAPLIAEVIVKDDGAVGDVEAVVRANLAPDYPCSIRVERVAGPLGYIRALNEIGRAAPSEFILNLDDDAFIVDVPGVRLAVEILQRDPAVAAVAFAQTNGDGELWPNHVQPSAKTSACAINCFTGFGYLMRKSALLAVNGFRETIYYAGWEKELCLRWLERGFKVIYSPACKVGHLPELKGRDPSLFLRYTTRNNCLTALYDEPWLMVAASVPVRLYAYFQMRKAGHIADPGGFKWILGEIWRCWPTVKRDRTPLKWQTFRRWRELRRTSPAYPLPSTAASENKPA